MTLLNKKINGFQILATSQFFLYIFLYFQAHLVQKNYLLLPHLLIQLSFIFGLYFVSLFFLKKNEEKFLNSASVSTLILFFGILYRLISLFYPPLLSDDVYYYIWHGRVAAHSFNPYLYTPASPELSFLQDKQIWNFIPFKDLPPAYPPFTMSMFWLAYLIGGSSLVKFKILQLVPEILTLIFGCKLLKEKNINVAWILIYAWCPLPILELIGMGHSDAWGVAFLTIFLYYFYKNKMAPAFIFLALATLVKWIPLLFLPLIFRKLSWKQRLLASACFAGTFLLLYSPYLSAGKNVFGLLPTYLKSWEFNGSFYKIIRLFFERADYTHMFVSGLIALWALVTAWRNPPLEKGLLSITFVFFLFFHTVYPWYLCWFLPLLLIQTSWAAYAWIFTSMFSYWILIGYRTQGIWKENAWVLFLEYFPVIALLVIQKIYKIKQAPQLPKVPAENHQTHFNYSNPS